MSKKLGVIGGLGSKATAYFFNMLVDLTDASSDQEHVELLIHNHPQIPDRTAYILGESEQNPIEYIKNDAIQLVESGCEVLYVPCNTAHYFIDQFDLELRKYFVHMIDETVREIERRAQAHVLLLGTSGTIQTALYQSALFEKGIKCSVLPEHLQVLLMSLIYDEIKVGKNVTEEMFAPFATFAKHIEADSVILGCTELSLLKTALHLPEFYVDAMECAVKACILQVGKQLKRV